ncbi:MAG TPA: DsbC family protein [Nitrospirota bacterium]|nr:DsbC family protein [Nitrospirota bacterium]
MKRTILIVLILGGLVSLLPATLGAFSSDHPGCNGDCKECHKLEKKDAEAIVKKLNPALSVVDVKQAIVKGLWQVDVDAGEGKRGPIFLDYSKKNLIVVQQIIPVDSIGKEAPRRKIDFSKLPLKDALVMGPKTAKKKVAVFTDPDCPYCRKLHEEIKKVLEKRKDIAFYIFLRPLPMHPEAPRKVEAILCERSLSLLDDALSGKPVPAPACSTAKVQMEKNIALADSLEFRGTPTMVREDGTVNPGFLAAEPLEAWIDGK